MQDEFDFIGWPLELVKEKLTEKHLEYNIKEIVSPYEKIDESLTLGYVVRQTVNKEGIYQLLVCLKREGRCQDGLQNQ